MVDGSGLLASICLRGLGGASAATCECTSMGAAAADAVASVRRGTATEAEAEAEAEAATEDGTNRGAAAAAVRLLVLARLARTFSTWRLCAVSSSQKSSNARACADLDVSRPATRSWSSRKLACNASSFFVTSSCATLIFASGPSAASWHIADCMAELTDCTSFDAGVDADTGVVAVATAGSMRGFFAGGAAAAAVPAAPNAGRLSPDDAIRGLARRWIATASNLVPAAIGVLDHSTNPYRCAPRRNGMDSA